MTNVPKAIVTIPPYAPFISEVVRHPAVEGLRLRAKGLSIQEICGELRTRRDALLRAFAMAEEQGWDVKARDGKLAG